MGLKDDVSLCVSAVKSLGMCYNIMARLGCVGLLSYFDQMLSRGNFFLELQLVTKNPLSMCVFCGLAAMDKDIIEQLLRDFLGPMLPHPV